MQALLETTAWPGNTANHTYLLDGNTLIAYIRSGTTVPFYFKSPIKGFDRRARKFDVVSPNPFETPVVASHVVSVEGSKGQTYTVDTSAGTCTCPGYTYRGACKHVKQLELA
jgi:hypothetical protein